MDYVSSFTEKWLDETFKKQLIDFKCKDKDGDNHVELFLQEQALKLMHENLVRTRLFFDQSQNLIGFYSLFNDTVKINKDKRKQLNIQLPQRVKEIPAIRLHYIGVDDRYRGNGYGKLLMASVLDNCAIVAKNTGCTLIIVESTESVRGFYKKFDFKHIHRQGNHYIMAMNTKNLLDLV